MKNSILAVFVLFSCLSASAQEQTAVITYNRLVDWIELNAEMPWMTSEEIDRNRLTWGNFDRKGKDYELRIKGKTSTYTAKEEESNEGYSWKSGEYLLIRDHKTKMTQDWIETLDKKYIIKDKFPKYRWKIYNEIKEVAGYLCMKAETKNPIKNQIITAWYTSEIPISAGPEGLHGLPGIILEVSINQACTITATDVNLAPESLELPIPKKMKGKEISYEEFNQKIKKYIDQKIEGERNPYWRIRY